MQSEATAGTRPAHSARRSERGCGLRRCGLSRGSPGRPAAALSGFCIASAGTHLFGRRVSEELRSRPAPPSRPAAPARAASAPSASCRRERGRRAAPRAAPASCCSFPRVCAWEATPCYFPTKAAACLPASAPLLAAAAPSRTAPPLPFPALPPRRHCRPRLRSSRGRAGRGAPGDGEAGPGAPPRAEDGGRAARRRLPQRPEGRPAAGSRRAAAGLRALRGAGGPSLPQPGAAPAGPPGAASPRQVRKRRAAARSRGPGERRRCRPRAGKSCPGRAPWGGPAPPGGGERAASRGGGGPAFPRSCRAAPPRPPVRAGSGPGAGPVPAARG